MARGQNVLCEYAAYQGNFNKVAAECLAKCPAHNAKFTYNADKHTFNFIVHDGYSARPSRSSPGMCLPNSNPAGSLCVALTRPTPQPSWRWQTRSSGARFRLATWRR